MCFKGLDYLLDFAFVVLSVGGVEGYVIGVLLVEQNSHGIADTHVKEAVEGYG